MEEDLTEIQQKLKDRYPNVPLLMFYRSLEKAKTDGELFDILEEIEEYPVVWGDKAKRWKHTDDLLRSKMKPYNT